MNAIILTPAALRAALATTRKMGAEREDNDDAAAFFIDALNVLEALLDPAHQPVPAVNPLAASPLITPPDIAKMRLQAAAPQAPTAPALSVEALHGYGGPAPALPSADPPIAIPPLPTGQGGMAPSISAPPAAEAEAPPTAPAPAPPPDLAAEGTPSAEPTPAPDRPAPPPIQAKRTAGGAPVLVWTDERLALLAAERPTCTDEAALLARLNALPGKPIASLDAMRVKCTALGIRRTAETLDAIARASGSKGGATTEQRTPTIDSGIRSPERLALLRRMWPDGAFTIRQIFDAWNALPGPKYSASQALYNVARAIGLETPRPMPPEAVAAAPPPPADHFADVGEMVPPAQAEAPAAVPAPTAAAPEPRPVAPVHHGPDAAKTVAPPPPPRSTPPEDLPPAEQAAIADAAVEAKHERVRASLRQLVAEKRDKSFPAVAGVATAHKVQVSVAVRLLGEVRREKAA